MEDVRAHARRRSGGARGRTARWGSSGISIGIVPGDSASRLVIRVSSSSEQPGSGTPTTPCAMRDARRQHLPGQLDVGAHVVDEHVADEAGDGDRPQARPRSAPAAAQAGDDEHEQGRRPAGRTGRWPATPCPTAAPRSRPARRRQPIDVIGARLASTRVDGSRGRVDEVGSAARSLEVVERSGGRAPMASGERGEHGGRHDHQRAAPAEPRARPAVGGHRAAGRRASIAGSRTRRSRS